MFEFSKKDLVYAVGATYFARGEKLFLQKAVQELSFSFDEVLDALLIDAKVRGSSGYSYEVAADIDIEESQRTGELELSGECTCPVGYNCKHVVAACLQYLQQIKEEGNKLEDPVNWLKNLSIEKQYKKPDSDNQYRFSIYYLSWYDDNNSKLAMIPKKVFYKRNGDLSKPQKLSLYNFVHGQKLEGNSEQDKQVIDILSSSVDYYTEQALLRGTQGATLLEALLETGKCYWEGVDNPVLSLGDTAKLKLKWQKLKSGDLQLQLRLDRPGCEIIAFQPWYYLDKKNWEIGKIDQGKFRSEQLEQLMYAPILKKEDVHEFSRQLLIHYPDLDIPSPVDDLIEEKQDSKLTPCLSLYSRSVNQQLRYYLLLSFQYEQWKFTAFPLQEYRSIENGDKVIKIKCDRQKEQECINLLEDYGFVREAVFSNLGEFVQSNTETFENQIANWQNFIDQQLPQLQDEGWKIEIEGNFHLEIIEADDVFAHIEQQDNDWFDLHFDLQLGDKKVPLLPLVVKLLNQYDVNDLPESVMLESDNGKYFKIAGKLVEPVLKTVTEIYNHIPESASDHLRFGKFDAANLSDLQSNYQQLQIQGAQKLIKLGKKLRNFKGIKPVALPSGLRAQLRDYQQTGVNWLQFLREYELNGILADDMGLGKTLQTLTHLLIEKEQKRAKKPSLIIAPTSLMSNWKREAESFCPQLKVLILQGMDRHAKVKQIKEVDIVLSTYPLLPRDEKIFMQHKWHYVILDEAQMIKNPRSKAGQIVRMIDCKHKLCLTGTPMENHLGELWSLFDFLMPGFLGDEQSFKRLYRNPIEKHDDREVEARLARKISPFLLRRNKNEVAKELPEKTEIIRSIALGKEQALLYESIRLTMEKKVRKVIAEKGLARSHITILDAILKLRQVCCDPQLLNLEEARRVKESAKMQLLMEILPEMIEEGRKILLFSQFTKMLAIIEKELKKQKIRYSKLTGQTRKRDEVIEQFKRGLTDVFLISLKAGGVGLNLTEADTVIIYDPWWNPAAENQAADRSYRIGQDKPVFVYKLLVENSLEEKIIAMQEKKQKLAEGMYGSKQSKENPLLTGEAIEDLFQPLPIK